MAPMLSSQSVLLISTAFTSAYVLSIYVHPSTRIKLQQQSLADSLDDPPRDRNHPSILKRRLVAVSSSTLLSLSSLPVILAALAEPALTPHAALNVAIKLTGVALPSSWKEAGMLAAAPLALTMTLFTGSLYTCWLAGELPGCKGWSWREACTWRNVRNLLVGPLTEELVFRSCIIAVAALGGQSKKQIIFLSPLYFGIAHVHHAYESWSAGGRTWQSFKGALLQSLFQFTYTTLFGWYASFLFMRTGSVWPCFLVHAFCNTMGFPNLGWALQVFPERKIPILGSYAVGIAGFVYGLWRWTEPALFGGSLYWR